MNFVIGLVCLFGILYFGVLAYKRRKSLSLLNKDRNGGLTKFKKYCSQFNYSDEFIVVVYNQILLFLKLEDFNIDPDDDLIDLYNFTDDEIRDLLTDISINLQMPNVHTDEIRSYEVENGKIRNPLQIIKFITFRTA